MLFRCYLPLFALLKQTDSHREQASLIKDLLLDERASQFVRDLMSEVPSLQHLDYSTIVGVFLSDPWNIENNQDLRALEKNLALCLNVELEELPTPGRNLESRAVNLMGR